MPDPYRVDFTPAAQRDLKALARTPPDQDLLRRIDEAVSGLAADPRPPGASKLQGSDFWRIVVGDYRIIYAPDDKNRVVGVARIRHRREVYRQS